MKKAGRRGLITAVFWLLVSATAVGAHGGGKAVVINEPVGEMTATVWLNPPTPDSGETVHLTVGLGAADTGTTILNEVVEVVVMDGDREVWRGLATNAASTNRLFYEADITAVPQGNYEIFVHIVGQGQISLPLEIVASQLNLPLYGAVGLAAIVINLLFFSLWRRAPQPAKDAPRKRSAQMNRL